MVESSKILTVSYGTFSCTLEGFEDSFSTMKAIAEYFRDLAAEDRYFGAEPPTPDAEMLSRIAEREIARKVDAQTTEDGIHLRASAPALAVVEPAMPPEPQRPAAAPDMADLADMGQHEAAAEAEIDDSEIEEAVDQVAAAVEEDFAEDVSAEDQTEAAEAFFAQSAPEADPVADETPAALTEAPAHPDPSSVAAKLQRIRAVVGQSDDTAEEAYAEDIAIADDDDDAAQQMVADLVDDAVEEDTAIDDGMMSEDAPLAESADASFEDEAAIEDDDVAIDTDAQEAEMTAPASDDAADETVAEDDMADDAIAMASDVDINLDDIAFDDEDEAEDTTEVAFASDIAVDDVTEDDTPEAPAEAAISAPDDTDAQISAVLRNLERAGATIPDDVEITPIAADDAAMDTDAALPESDDTNEIAKEQDDAEAAKPTLRARILRVAKRVTPAAETSDDQSEGVAEAEAETAEDDNDLMADVMADIAMAEEEDANAALDHAALDGADDIAHFDDVASDDLPAADEEDLQRALNDAAAEEVEEVTAAVEDTADAQEAPAEDDAEAIQPRAGRHTLPDTDDAEMSRIMEQADEELSNPESSRRRAAIAQLKAAVAATEAARQLGEDKSDNAAEPEEAFREDLNQVVRPRRASRPASTEARSERPRPAPLKLVASQRVDTGEALAAETAPVQPRRVAMTSPVTETDADSFAEFAEEMGAVDLPDLLEAAAAYTAYVEGATEFSRPQIMKKVQATTDQTFTREDGLRSFGTLLRQGRINKAGNGRFQVSDQTRFKPEQKAG